MGRLKLTSPLNILPKLCCMVFDICQRCPDSRILPRVPAQVLDYCLRLVKVVLCPSVEFASRRRVGLCAIPKRFPFCLEAALVLSNEALGTNGISSLHLIVLLDERSGLANVLRQEPLGALPTDPKTEACNSEPQ